MPNRLQLCCELADALQQVASRLHALSDYSRELGGAFTDAQAHSPPSSSSCNPKLVTFFSAASAPSLCFGRTPEQSHHGEAGQVVWNTNVQNTKRLTFIYAAWATWTSRKESSGRLCSAAVTAWPTCARGDYEARRRGAVLLWFARLRVARAAVLV
jgi:hypothetical protein